jgi:diadenosine tetraphosphate (Ap4A) HIT family hydrolase
MTNPTAKKFGYPRSLIAETAYWLVLVRPSQPTLSSLVLVCKEPVAAFGDLSPEAFADLATATRGIERTLSQFVGYERINYLMLMMVDRDVHFHVLPRYEGAREFEGRTFVDQGWPGPPKLSPAVDLDEAALDSLTGRLRALWSAA